MGGFDDVVGRGGYSGIFFFSHDAANPACRCILCEFNHVPQDGELVYNRYLPVISMVWVAFMILLVYMMRRYMNKR